MEEPTRPSIAAWAAAFLITILLTLLAAEAAAARVHSLDVLHRGRTFLSFEVGSLNPDEIRSAHLALARQRHVLDPLRVRAAVRQAAARRGVLRVRIPERWRRLLRHLPARRSARAASHERLRLVVVTYRRTRRAPAAPTGLTARAGDRSVALAWAPNAESDLAGYRVYRQSPDGGWPAIAATATTRHLDSGLLNGTRYTYRVTAYDRRGNESRPSSEVSAVPTAASTSPGSGTPVSPLSAWRSGFETGDFREWDWWGQTQPEQYPSTMGVVDPTTRGVPYKAGTKVGWFQTTPQDIAVGRYHAKLYKYFHSGAGDRPNWSCPNVSGTYRAWFYLPSNYAVLNSNAVVLFQFKDQYWINRATGEETSSPTWWLALKSPADAGVAAPRADYPVAVVEHWDYWNLDPGYAHPGLRVLAPLGRWFEVRAEVYDKDHIEFYLDGQQLATGSNSHYPVGCSHPDSFNWIFGIGQYSSSPGVLYADEASYTPR